MIATTQLGAAPQEDGVAFGVWAPHADEVAVIGEFNHWDRTKNPCERDENGNWFAFVNEANPGQAYKFWIRNGEREFQRIDPRAREVSNSVGHGIIGRTDFDWENDSFTPPPMNEMVIYEMHIGTFNTDGNGVGSFGLAIEKLPYLRDLGINVIELMPIAEFAGDYSWGYNPAHPFAIESAYGGPMELKRFIREAHRHGIAVVIDVVYNHFGPSDLDLWQFDGWSENNKGGIYFYNDWRSATPWGDTRPDYGRGEVRQFIYDNAMMWIEEYHADGLRFDMTLYIRSVDGNEDNMIAEGISLSHWINQDIQERFPGKISIAEDLRNNHLMTADGGACFSTQWDANFVHPIRDQIIKIDDAHRSVDVVRNAICFRFNSDAFERVIYTESHDEVANGKQRVVSEIDPSDEPNRYAVKRSTLGACVMFTSPGIPMLMQGQEFLRDKWFNDGRPIDWSRCEKYASVVQMYHDLIQLRLNRRGITAGLTGQHVNVFHLNEEPNILAMHRCKESGPKDDVVVVFKFSEGTADDYRIGFPKPGEWKLRFNGDAKVYGDAFDGIQSDHLTAEAVPHDGFEFSATINIGAYSCLIFSQDA
ncbi:MAG: alpha-amylase family glycosyl hydrolase [Pirellulaceae bacterium]